MGRLGVLLCVLCGDREIIYRLKYSRYLQQRQILEGLERNGDRGLRNGTLVFGRETYKESQETINV